jgi:hypothetical protein
VRLAGGLALVGEFANSMQIFRHKDKGRLPPRARLTGLASIYSARSLLLAS